MSKYSISICKKEELLELQLYIKKYWKEDHAFVTSLELLKWQHESDFQINYVIARNNLTNNIDGIAGFIPTSHFDKNLSSNSEFWSAIWSTNENAGPGLGMALMKFWWEKYDPTYIGLIGIGPVAKKLWSFLKFDIDYLRHYYYLKTNSANCKIAKTTKIQDSQYLSDNSFCIYEITSLEGIELIHKYKPVKTIDYLINRYQKHPIYNYRFFGIYANDELLCIWVIRKQFVEDASCLRIIDMYGDIRNITSLSKQMEKLLQDEGSEYIDCLNYGINESVFNSMGFRNLDFDGDEIIPNYFEPFMQKNLKIELSSKSIYNDYVIFRGDADQDRPNIID